MTEKAIANAKSSPAQINQYQDDLAALIIGIPTDEYLKRWNLGADTDGTQ